MTLAEKFDNLLRAMLTKKPKPWGKPSLGRPSSNQGSSEDYTGTQTRKGKSANTSAKPKRKSPR